MQLTREREERQSIYFHFGTRDTSPVPANRRLPTPPPLPPP